MQDRGTDVTLFHDQQDKALLAMNMKVSEKRQLRHRTITSEVNVSEMVALNATNGCEKSVSSSLKTEAPEAAEVYLGTSRSPLEMIVDSMNGTNFELDKTLSENGLDAS